MSTQLYLRRKYTRNYKYGRKNKKSLTGVYCQSIVKRNVEVKYKDIWTSNTVPEPSTFWRIIFLNGITEGSLPNERIGIAVDLKKVIIRGWIQQNVYDNANSLVQLVRLVLVLYKRSGNVAITAEDLFMDATKILTPINLNTAGKYIVLADKFIKIDNTHPCTSFFIQKSIPCRMKFSTTTNALTAVVDNSLWLLATTSVVNIESVGPSLQFYTRIRYTDA